MAEYKIDDTVDITDVVCPTTFVKAKVVLEELDEGQILSIKMNDGEPVQNVPEVLRKKDIRYSNLSIMMTVLTTLSLKRWVTELSVRATGETFKTEISENEKLVLADFYSDSCIPCKRMSPLLAELEENNDALKVVKLNINFDAETAEEYNVTSVPTIVFFRNGKEEKRISGAVKKAQIEEIINSLK